MRSLDGPGSSLGKSGGANLKRFKLTEDLHPGVDYAEAVMRAFDPSNDVIDDLGTDRKHKIFDPWGRMVVLEGTYLIARRADDAARWEVLSVEGGHWHFGKAAANISVGSAGLVTIWRTDEAGNESATAIQVTAQHWQADSISNNDKVYVWQDQSGLWYALKAGGGPALNLAVATLVTDMTHSMPSVECVVRYTLSGSFPSGNLTIQNVPHSNDGTVITSYVFEGTSGATALIHDKLHTAVLAPEHGTPVADGSFIWVTCPTREPEEPPTQQQLQGDTSGSPPPQAINPGGAFFG